MKWILLLPALLLGACSSKDEVFIRVYGHRCFDDDPKTMRMRIIDNGATYHVGIYHEFGTPYRTSGCELTVDKKTQKVVEILLSQ